MTIKANRKVRGCIDLGRHITISVHVRRPGTRDRPQIFWQSGYAAYGISVEGVRDAMERQGWEVIKCYEIHPGRPA